MLPVVCLGGIFRLQYRQFEIEDSEHFMDNLLESHNHTVPKKSVKSEDKLLVSRQEAADLLSISQRAVDYLIASKTLSTRRIGARVLIPTQDLRRFARADHPERLAS